MGCPAVVDSLKEAGDDLFTFLRFPASPWKLRALVGCQQMEVGAKAAA